MDVSIADEADLTKYQTGYDAENRRIPTPHYKVTSLIPPIRKHTFAPEVDPAGLIDDEAEFEALNGIDWSSSTFQEKEQRQRSEEGRPGCFRSTRELIQRAANTRDMLKKQS